MADYRDLGKVADDLFGKGTRKDAQKPGTEQEKIHPNPEEPEVFPDIRPQEDAPETGRDEFSSGIEEVSDAILDNIRKIRQMVESDLRDLDEASRKTQETDFVHGYTENAHTDVPAENRKSADNSPFNTPFRPDPAAGQTTAVPGASPSQPAASADSGKKEEERPAMEELEELIGLDSIKADVKELIDLVKTQKLRKEQGLKSVPVSLHLVFSGNPGTGKTTVARILARLYKEIGVLSQGQLIEVDRSGLVAGFIGQTAIKTQEKIQQAMGGILFIDEAYTLAKEGQDYGQEAIDTILKAMEDNRDGFVVIVAGYTDLMKKFIESNPGLKSRFNKYFEFPDYTAEELMAIFDLQCRKYEYALSEEAKADVRKTIEEMEQTKGANFANARDVRNLFERIITDQARRIAKLENPTAEDLKTILPVDVNGSEIPEADTETDRKADAETDRKADAETDRKADAETDRKADAETDRTADAEIDRKTDAETDRTVGSDAGADNITGAETESQNQHE